MEKVQLKVILLLDYASRSRLKVNVSELIMHDVTIVSSLRDITDYVLSKTNKVVILEDYLRTSNNYSDLVLYKEAFDLEYIYLGLDDSLCLLMNDISSVYKIDPSLIDYDRLYSVVFEDTALQRRFLEKESKQSDLEAFALSVIQNESYDDKVRKLADNFLANIQNIYDKEEQIKNLTSTLDDFTSLLQGHQDHSQTIESVYRDLISKSKHLNRTLKQYESILSKDVYDKIILSKYIYRPTIIYLKEYEELLYLESFLMTIFELFQQQAKQSVKILRLYDSSSSKKILTVPSYYKILQNSFQNRDVVSNDFIVKTGNYKEVFDILLTNSNRLGVLVVVDCKDHSDTVLTGSYLHLSMCRNSKHIQNFGLDPVSTIVNNEAGNPLSWDHYPEYSKFTDNKEKFLFLSSREVMQKIYELNKVFAQVGGQS